MQAILISEENLPKIQEHQNGLIESIAHFHPKPYLDSRVNWYYIQGYVNVVNGVANWSAYPESLLIQDYQCDLPKMKTDWNQIVIK